jgi:hypothetical protein
VGEYETVGEASGFAAEEAKAGTASRRAMPVAQERIRYRAKAYLGPGQILCGFLITNRAFVSPEFVLEFGLA